MKKCVISRFELISSSQWQERVLEKWIQAILWQCNQTPYSPNTKLKKMFVFFYDIFTKQLLYLLSYAREWTRLPLPTKQISAGCSAWGETHWACSGNDVTLQDNGTQAWEKLIFYWRTGADFNQMCVCRWHLLEERNALTGMKEEISKKELC